MFWSTSVGPTWSHWLYGLNPFGERAEPGTISKIFKPKQCQQSPPNGVRCVLLTEHDAEEMQTLLNTHFQLQTRCRFMISVDRIRRGFRNGWLGIGLRDIDKDKELIACVISKPAFSFVENSGIVDYFCVSRLWRKKSLGSYLLQEILRYTMEEKRYVHFFLKEGYPLFALPPLYSSRYIYRLSNKNHHTSVKITTIVSKKYEDSQIYHYNEKNTTVKVCVVNHFHISVPEAWKIGEVFWIECDKTTPLTIQKRAVESVVDQCDYDLLLLDSRMPHDTAYKWKRDSAYSWYVFNYNPVTFYTQKPFLTF